MFESIITDHQDNSQKLYLDKDYFYEKKFQPINSLDDIKYRNNIEQITKRQQNKFSNLSINEFISLRTSENPKVSNIQNGVFHFQNTK